MSVRQDIIECDLAVIGAGLAGSAAALFAARRGLSVVQAGGTGAIAYTSGFLDILGAIPPATTADEGGQIFYPENPFAGLDDLLRLHPGHPYRLTRPATIRAALDEWVGFLAEYGPGYRAGGVTNVTGLSPAGTLKHTFAMPGTMWSFVRLFDDKPPCLLVDFHGLNGYSARQIAAVLGQDWPGLRTARVPFPSLAGAEVFPENSARSLELPARREALAESLRPLLGDAVCLGLPALLGMHRPDEVRADLEARLGVTVFEIPTMPPSVPGIRLREAVEDGLPRLGVRQFNQQMVRPEKIGTYGRDGLDLVVHGQGVERRVRCRGAILATGRFLAGGLAADRNAVRETVFSLPVTQPASRSDWHRTDCFDLRGHPVNRAGLEVDDQFRPLGPDGGPACPLLFAAGSVLAHQDWMRMKCGAGVALATALGAVEAFMAEAGCRR